MANFLVDTKDGFDVMTQMRALADSRARQGIAERESVANVRYKDVLTRTGEAALPGVAADARKKVEETNEWLSNWQKEQRKARAEQETATDKSTVRRLPSEERKAIAENEQKAKEAETSIDDIGYEDAAGRALRATEQNWKQVASGIEAEYGIKAPKSWEEYQKWAEHLYKTSTTGQEQQRAEDLANAQKSTPEYKQYMDIVNDPNADPMAKIQALEMMKAMVQGKQNSGRGYNFNPDRLNTIDAATTYQENLIHVEQNPDSPMKRLSDDRLKAASVYIARRALTLQEIATKSGKPPLPQEQAIPIARREVEEALVRDPNAGWLDKLMGKDFMIDSEQLNVGPPQAYMDTTKGAGQLDEHQVAAARDMEKYPTFEALRNDPNLTPQEKLAKAQALFPQEVEKARQKAIAEKGKSQKSEPEKKPQPKPKSSDRVAGSLHKRSKATAAARRPDSKGIRNTLQSRADDYVEKVRSRKGTGKVAQN